MHQMHAYNAKLQSTHLERRHDCRQLRVQCYLRRVQISLDVYCINGRSHRGKTRAQPAAKRWSDHLKRCATRTLAMRLYWAEHPEYPAATLQVCPASPNPSRPQALSKICAGHRCSK